MEGDDNSDSAGNAGNNNSDGQKLPPPKRGRGRPPKLQEGMRERRLKRNPEENQPSSTTENYLIAPLNFYVPPRFNSAIAVHGHAYLPQPQLNTPFLSQVFQVQYSRYAQPRPESRPYPEPCLQPSGPFPEPRRPCSQPRPPAESSRPPAESSRPPAESSIPPAESSIPPAESSRPPAESSIPPAESSRPPAESSRTHSEPRPPAESSKPHTITPRLESSKPHSIAPHPESSRPYPTPFYNFLEVKEDSEEAINATNPSPVAEYEDINLDLKL